MEGGATRARLDFGTNIGRVAQRRQLIRADGHSSQTMKKTWWRLLIEVGFIIFLFYSNLLMGEFERSGEGQTKGLWWAVADVFTTSNFAIGVIAAMIGYVLFEFLRTKF